MPMPLAALMKQSPSSVLAGLVWNRQVNPLKLVRLDGNLMSMMIEYWFTRLPPPLGAIPCSIRR